MKVKDLIIKENDFQGKKSYQLFIIIDDKEYMIGTLKQGPNFNFINSIHKEYKGK